MKKSIIASLFMIVLLSACKETETTTVDITGSATIKGTVLADFEKVNTPFESEPISGVLVRILWNSEDLAVISDGDNIRRSAIDTTDANGEFSIEVPTIDNGVSFTIEIDDFQREVTFNDGSTTATKTVTFSSTSTTATARSGEQLILEFDLADNFKNDSDDLEKFGTIAGIVEADLEQVNTKGISEVAAGANVTVKWENNNGDALSIATTTDANGAYTVQVPTNDVDGDFEVVFEEYSAAVTYFNGIENVTETLTFSEASEDVGVQYGETVEVNNDFLSNLTENLNQIVIITGTVEANSERINTPDLLEVAVGATVIIKWEDSETGADVEFVTTTDASGVYRVEVPYNEIDGNQVDIEFLEFTTGVDYNDGFRDVTGFSATFNSDASNTNQGLSVGTILEVNHNYGSNFTDELPTFATIDGTFVVRTNAIAGSEVNTPVSNASVRISWFDDDGIRRGTFITTDANGEYSIEVNLSVTPTDQFFVQFPEVIIDTYQFTNATPEDVTGTATYNQFETSFFLSAGQERTEDRTDETPDNVVEN
ncbi:MAG: hypothetical protein ABJG47_05670 [Ekhidna sp.]